ncbi:sialidase family protein [Agrilutibacter solisilvae]|uniref:Exo-alpha-sialidase n=1 Tax=Agrilutibacter solisilvae TaxID=2763317 RepID=A0A974Y2H5_9GAMM|nr:sialidase family protein [Lysobacter solisilvae]QSX79230.1 exo-alpha-sialidase [Lysobacter solisilvae]
MTMSKQAVWACLLALVWLPACTPSRAPATQSAAEATGHPAAWQARVEAWSLPVTAAAAAQPDLVRAPDGSLLLSWIEPREGGHVLRLARHADGRWGEPRTVAQGADWFVNWADTPHVAATADGALWAHWLRKSAQSTYAYDVVLSRSGDGGATWSAPQAVNADARPAEHGFVSLWPHTRDSLGVAWLDGRETAAGQAHAGHGGHEGGSGAMTLRAAVFDARLQRRDEARLDASTCDCCQTDVAMTARGPLIVFRDRTENEIRDIATSRWDQAGWTAPTRVHADNWIMPACPVNGPAVAARASTVVTAWYTAAGDMPTLKLARSDDAGDRFGAPVTVDRGEAVQGRVAVALVDEDIWVLWLREDAKGQSLQLARYAGDLSRELQRLEVARLQGRGRVTGLAQLAVQGERAHVVWTDVVDGHTQLRSARIMTAADRPD